MNREEMIDQYMHLVRPIAGAAARRSRGTLDYEDCYQEGIVGLINAIDHLIAKGQTKNPIPYLSKTVQNHLCRFPRRERGPYMHLHQPLPQGGDLHDLIPSPENLDDERDYQDLYQALDQLTPRQRHAVGAYLGEGVEFGGSNSLRWARDKGVRKLRQIMKRS